MCHGHTVFGVAVLFGLASQQHTPNVPQHGHVEDSVTVAPAPRRNRRNKPRHFKAMDQRPDRIHPSAVSEA